MGIPYRARVDERASLNLPGFHGGGYVRPPPSALPEGYGVVDDASPPGARPSRSYSGQRVWETPDDGRARAREIGWHPVCCGGSVT
jgi:hypothetical protein